MTFKDKKIVSEWLKGTLKCFPSLIVLSFTLCFFLFVCFLYHYEKKSNLVSKVRKNSKMFLVLLKGQEDS